MDSNHRSLSYDQYPNGLKKASELCAHGQPRCVRNDLSERLTDMRVWLDEHRYEPSTFAYFFVSRGMKIRVSFKVEDEAKKLAERFDGSLLDIPRAIDRSPTV